ncbi:hypothetical protein KEJ49_01945 [Candidatus Bathyarchaeota archaeon]|nr:hypothetical protein [Candidatus Bathyarchaeota archaeon]
MFHLKGVRSEKLGCKVERAIQRYDLNALTDLEIEIIEDENLPRLFGSRGTTIYIKSLAQSSSVELLALMLLHELAHLKGIRGQREAMNFAYGHLKLSLLKRLKLEAELFLSEAFRVRGEIDRGAERAMESW